MIRVLKPKPKVKEASSEKEVLKFVPLGGLEEVGRNCAYFEYGNEIVMVDVGIQFPEEETPGIDYIIPNVSSLEKKRENIRGLILTHGHYDHIHSLPYIIEKIGNPIIYTSAFTRALVEKRFQEFRNLPKPRFQVVKNGDKLRIGEYFQAEFFDVGHTIPDSIGLILDTPVGKLVHFGDFRLETDINGKPEKEHLKIFEHIGKMGVHSIFLDSTNAQEEGHATSERIVEKNLEELFQKANGRIIVATFGSLVTRLAEIIKIAERLGRKIALNGRTMKDNIQIAVNMGYIKTKKDIFIQLEEVNSHKDDKVMILTTGGQGEPNAGLTRIANGEHRYITLKRSDMVIFSSSVVPGNERSVQTLQDNIARQVDQVYNSRFLDIHASGHGPAEDLKLVIKLSKPKFVVPVHGYYFFRAASAKHAQSVGIPKENAILVDNGQVCELTKDTFQVTDKTVDASYVMVDGLGVGDVGEIVLRDRRLLAKEGMVVVITTLDRHNRRLLKNPDIISRGFIYLKENQGLLDDVRKKIRAILGRVTGHRDIEPDYLKTLFRDQLGQLLFTKTQRRPMIIPVIIEV
ncbi:MAG: ribonuclease J [Candidatus Harrisonbacteria bacterium]|nr:ribonuclease J [Candidatus Harrisonbacteria bacterium]